MGCWTFPQWLDLNAFLGSAFGALVGAMLGYWVASRIYKRERKDKQGDEKRLDRQLYDTALLLIERAAKGGRDTETSLKALHAKYTEAPYRNHKRSIPVNTPLTTLDRLDRERLLRAYRSVAGEEQGMLIWRETWKFCDGMKVVLSHCEGGVLTGQQDMFQCAERMGGHCRELFMLASSVLSEARDHGITDVVQRIDTILKGMYQMGFVHPDEMNDRLVEPIAGLFRDKLLTINQAYQLSDAHSKARSAFQRYGQIVDEVKGNLNDYADMCGGMAKVGEDLRDKMRGALP